MNIDIKGRNGDVLATWTNVTTVPRLKEVVSLEDHLGNIVEYEVTRVIWCSQRGVSGGQMVHVIVW
jgi:hypothetical protein